MSLSSELVSQFVKATNDATKTKSETIAYGTVVYDGKLYVKLDGSDLLTPVTTTTDVQDGERVTVMIKNHTATVTGNVSSPAARTDDVKKVGTQITEFENVMAYGITAEDAEFTNATIDSLYAKVVALEQANVGDFSALKADIEKLKVNFIDGKNISAEELNVINAEIEHIEAQFGEFTDISAEDLEAINADITNLKSYTADFVYVFAEVINAVRGDIAILDAKKVSAEELEATYVNIDFSNIDKAWMEEFYAQSGLIKYVITDDATITGHLDGVTIRGDLIETGTLVADRLVIKGSDGLYYQLNHEAGAFTEEAVPDWADNQLHGSTIVAKSITAEKVSVSDLVAFDATIGGFKITDNSIYSGVKSSVDNKTRGVYQDNDGQFALGDANNYLRFYKVPFYYKVNYDAETGEYSRTSEEVIVTDGTIVENAFTTEEIEQIVTNEDGTENIVTETVHHIVYSGTTATGESIYYYVKETYKLDISADSIFFSPNSNSSLKALAESDHVKIGSSEDGEPSIELSDDDTAAKQTITSTKTTYSIGDEVGTEIDTESVTTDTVIVNKEIVHAGWVWVEHNGNYGLMWRGGN